jgi:GlcNAc-P-P-Und epimerase
MIEIIGGSGFIGTNLCKQLKLDGRDFHIIDKNPSALFNEHTSILDIREGDRIAQHLKGNVIVHLAAEHRDNVKPTSLYDAVNVDATRNICRAARHRRIDKIIFTSSVAVYGFAEPMTDEVGSINPFNDYGRTKWEAECILREWAMEEPDKRSLTIIRPTVVFGPGNRGNVYNLLQQIASRRFIMIGKGENRKSMAFIDNVVAFLCHAIGFGPGIRTYNYVDEPALTMDELVRFIHFSLFGKLTAGLRLPYSLGLAGGYLADVISTVSGRNLPVSSLRIKKFAANTCFASQAHSLDDFAAPVPILEGLRRTIECEFQSEEPCYPIFFTE